MRRPSSARSHLQPGAFPEIEITFLLSLLLWAVSAIPRAKGRQRWGPSAF
jgi:hypothetical protein